MFNPTELGPVLGAHWRTYIKAIIWSFIIILLPYYGWKLLLLYQQEKSFSNILEKLSIAYGAANLVVLPIAQGFMVGREGRRTNMRFREKTGLAGLILITNMALAYLIWHEGVVCMLMAFPLLLGLMEIGVGLANWINLPDKMMRVSLIPLAVAFVVYDVSAAPTVMKSHVEDSVIIQAPPAKVWKYLTSAPLDNNPPRYWLWRIGMPMPNQLALSKAEQGGTLEFRLSNGMKFSSQISDFIPQKELGFIVTRQAEHPEIYGHISFDKGSFRLQDNGNGSTTLIATGYYSLLIAPTAYFDLWTRDIIHHVHQRVFDNIRHRAEVNNEV